jgi:hypothetical protein
MLALGCIPPVLLDGSSRGAIKSKRSLLGITGGALIGMSWGTSEDQGFHGEEKDQQDD